MAIDIDPVDVKILQALIFDSRSKVKDIAKECNLSTTAISKRIDRLKKLGVITGAVLIVNMNEIGCLFPCSIEIENIKKEQTEQIIKLLKQRSVVLVESFSTGKSDLVMFLVTKSMSDTDNLKSVIRKYSEPGKISVSFWNTPYLLYENLKIESTPERLITLEKC